MWKRDQSVQPSGSQHDALPSERKAPENLIMNLGNSMSIKGELSGSEDLTLYGQMEGSIRLPDHTEKVDIGSTGTLVGDLVSPRLAIADGGCIRGKVQTPASASAEAKMR
jgi:cytoskeletal protein CcmA (bactofilin family)